MTPAATAPTPTAPARMMNARRDQSGMPASGDQGSCAHHAGRAARSGSDPPRGGVTTGLEMSSSQPRTSRPAPTATAVATAAIAGVGERIAERGEEADHAEAR